MTNENYTDITFVLDRSGSMQGCVSDTIGGFNSFINKQREVEGKCRINTYVFDQNYKQVHENVPIAELGELTEKEYSIGGLTAYFDALGRAINDAGSRFAKLSESERPGRVLFVVITDGHENASKEFNRDQISAMIKKQEGTYDWDFVFLGADFDAVTSYGDLISKSNRSANYSKGQTMDAFSQLCSNVTSYRGVNVSAKNAVDLTADIGDSN